MTHRTKRNRILLTLILTTSIEIKLFYKIFDRAFSYYPQLLGYFELFHIYNYKQFVFWNFLEEDLTKILVDETFFSNSVLKLCFSSCRGEQRPEYFIYQNYNIPLLVLQKEMLVYNDLLKGWNADKILNTRHIFLL